MDHRRRSYPLSMPHPHSLDVSADHYHCHLEQSGLARTSNPKRGFLIITFANALEGTNGIVTKVELVDARAVAGCVVKAGPYGIFILFEAGWLEGPDVNVLHKPKNSSLDSIIIRVE